MEARDEHDAEKGSLTFVRRRSSFVVIVVVRNAMLMSMEK
jgi:hypothetical protein